MLKYLLLVFVAVFTLQTPHVSAQSNSFDALLLRIDAMILQMELLKREVVALKDNGSTVSPSVLGVQTSKILTQSLTFGSTNSDIVKIQKLLSTDPSVYAYGVASGFFGPKTEEAIRKFQIRFSLDPVGVVGPATTALLEGFLAMYPGGNYPADIFNNRPRVLGASTSVTPKPTTITPSVSTSLSSNPFRSIEVEMDHGEAFVGIEYKNDDEKEFVVESDSESGVVRAISKRIGVSESYIESVISFEEEDNDKDYDEDDADDAIDDAKDALNDAEDEIDEADDDGEDVEYARNTLDEAEDEYRDARDAYEDEDYDEATERAMEAKDLAEDAEDRIGEEEDDDGGRGNDKKGDSDDIDSIEVTVREDESDVVVEYENGDEFEFEIEEDKIDNIIEEIADELNIREDTVEDLIEYDFGRLDEIQVYIEDGEASVKVVYTSGVLRRLTLDEDSESDLIEEIADEIDEDEDDVGDVIDFDYN